MSMSVVTLLYLIASVCFIQALKGLSNPKTARIGNTFGMAGMAIAILTTIALIVKQASALGSDLSLGLACCSARSWSAVQLVRMSRRKSR
jgi:NAD(P) transhydrogenase subunit beta